MSEHTADVVICGAGIAGIASAYHLATQFGMKDVLLVDERPPLSLTSDKSTECYRNWWPGPGDAMVSMMNRSIDILERLAEESGNVFRMNRRGYLFATADPTRVSSFVAQAKRPHVSAPARCASTTAAAMPAPYQPAQAEGFQDGLDGADLITDPDLIREHFPYLSRDTVAVIHPRRCGWFSAQQLGMYMLEAARASGVRLVEGRVEAIKREGGRVAGVVIATPQGEQQVSTRNFVNAAGPFLHQVGALLDLAAAHPARTACEDLDPGHARCLPAQRPAPDLDRRAEARLARGGSSNSIREDPELGYLLGTFPEGVHARPEGPDDSPVVLILWTYDAEPVCADLSDQG